MGFLPNKCTLKIYDSEVIHSCQPFDCGNSDLNDFFCNDALNYYAELLGKTYCFTLDENPETIVCVFTISNDSIKTFNLPNARKKKVNKDIPRQKQMKSYPTVLIGRLGVNKNYRLVNDETDRTGKQLMNFIKILVYWRRKFNPLKYYSHNEFIPLFSNEEQEKEYTGIGSDAKLETRLLYFDLIILKS